MDTSDSTASSLALVVTLLAFAYLSFVEYGSSQGIVPLRPAAQLSSLLPTSQLLRLASVVAAVLSGMALVLSLTSPGVALLTILALGLLSILIVLDRGSKALSTGYPAAAATMALLLHVPLLRLLRLWRVAGGTLETNGREPGLDIKESPEHTTVVITEEGQERPDTRESSMIRSILRLDDATAREVMVPRVDIVALEEGASLAEAAGRMVDSGHSRLPVYKDTLDHISGVVHSRDLLPFLAEQGQYPPLEAMLRPTLFVPETKRLDDLLRELQEKRIHLAMVVDEFGGVEGLITLEDLLEEIVGEIEDEFSGSREPQVTPLPDGDILVDASVTLDYLSDVFSAPLPQEEVDTIGGLVLSILGKMPRVGDQIKSDSMHIEVVSLLGRRIRKLKLSRIDTGGAR